MINNRPMAFSITMLCYALLLSARGAGGEMTTTNPKSRGGVEACSTEMPASELVMRASSLLRQRAVGLAFDCLQICIDQHPRTNADCYGEMGSMLVDAGRHSEARVVLFTAMQIDPNGAERLAAFRQSYESVGELDLMFVDLGDLQLRNYASGGGQRSSDVSLIRDAISQYEKALSVNAGCKRAHRGLARIFSDLMPDAGRARHHLALATSDGSPDAISGGGSRAKKKEEDEEGNVDPVDLTKTLAYKRSELERAGIDPESIIVGKKKPREPGSSGDGWDNRGRKKSGAQRGDLKGDDDRSRGSVGDSLGVVGATGFSVPASDATGISTSAKLARLMPPLGKPLYESLPLLPVPSITPAPTRPPPIHLQAKNAKEGNNSDHVSDGYQLLNVGALISLALFVRGYFA